MYGVWCMTLSLMHPTFCYIIKWCVASVGCVLRTRKRQELIKWYVVCSYAILTFFSSADVFRFLEDWQNNPFYFQTIFGLVHKKV
jgi:hypothetical protein